MSTNAFKQLIDNYGRSPEERAKANELMEKVNEEARINWHNPEWRRSMAAVLTESILEGFTYETMYDQVVEVRRVGFDDRVILEEETGLTVFFIAKGGHIEASAMVSESMEIPRDTLGFHVYEFEDKMESGFAKSAATLRNLAVRRLDWGVNKQIKALVEAGIPNGSPYYISGAGVDQAALNLAIREVRDESDSGNVSIYGRSTVVDQIMDYPGFADEALEEIRNRGRLGTYRGANVISVRNWKDEQGVSFMPANELYVLGDDAGMFALYGGLKSKEYVEEDNWYWHYIGRQDFGGVLHHPERARRFVDTNITP
jgi:hypothetical protein